MEDVHGQRVLGYRHRGPHRKYSTLQKNQILTRTTKAYYWVETKGKTLEEIDAIFEGEKHSSVPDVEDVRLGKAEVDVGTINVQVEQKMKDL